METEVIFTLFSLVTGEEGEGPLCRMILLIPPGVKCMLNYIPRRLFCKKKKKNNPRLKENVFQILLCPGFKDRQQSLRAVSVLPQTALLPYVLPHIKLII